MNAQTIPHELLQRQVEAHPYPLVFATISGAHLYGFPSADSDFDLRGVHLLPLDQVVGLEVGEETVEKSGVREGFEMDLVTHDAKKFFTLMLKKNGYVLEQLLSPLVVHTTPEHEELKAIAKDCITRHHAHHYLGFAETQWRLFLKEEPPRVKPLLYVYRVLLTGIHLMRTGEVEASLLNLNQTAKLPYIGELVERKLAGPEKGRLDAADVTFHQREYERLVGELKTAAEASTLSEYPSAKRALESLLLRLRHTGVSATRFIPESPTRRRGLYSWGIQCINSQTREMFRRRVCFDASLCQSDDEANLVTSILNDSSKHGLLPQYRYLFREVSAEEHENLLAAVAQPGGGRLSSFCLPDYFEDENGIQLQVTDLIAKRTGAANPVVMGDVDSILRRPPSDMRAPSEWSVEASNDFVHFIQCVTILQQSRWWSSPLRLHFTGKAGPYSLEGPDLDSTTSALALIRQFVLGRDNIFRHAVSLFLSQVENGAKRTWVDYELKRFEQFLGSTPMVPELGNLSDITNEELINVITYGTGLFHRQSNKDLESRLTKLSADFDREPLMFACDSACRQMLGPAMRVAPLFYREFAHWSNSGQCARPTRVVTARLFDGKED
jgi:predicted nucleotidyltransferase